MWSKAFEKCYGDAVFYYGDREIPVKSLGLGSDYLGWFCRHVSQERNWRLDGITYAWIFSKRNLGVAKATAIAEALVKQGVEITDIPEETATVRLIEVSNSLAECSNCGALMTTNLCIDGRAYKFCPMCGRKFK